MFRNDLQKAEDAVVTQIESRRCCGDTDKDTAKDTELFQVMEKRRPAVMNCRKSSLCRMNSQ